MEDEEDTYCCYNCEYVDSETGEDYGSEEDQIVGERYIGQTSSGRDYLPNVSVELRWPSFCSMYLSLSI